MKKSAPKMKSSATKKSTELKKTVSASGLKKGLSELGLRLPHGYQIVKRKAKK